jgi:protoporphyrinogen oxidase
MGRVLKALSKDAKIQTNRIVSEVKYDDRNIIKVLTKNGEEYSFDKLILTLPLKVL